jgi:hypothetical protein
MRFLSKEKRERRSDRPNKIWKSDKTQTRGFLCQRTGWTRPWSRSPGTARTRAGRLLVHRLLPQVSGAATPPGTARRRPPRGRCGPC